MPSFFTRNMPRQQLPLTPPEFVPSYNNNGCGNMQYQLNTYSNQGRLGSHDEGRYDMSHRYQPASLPAAPPMAYQQPVGYAHSTHIPTGHSFYEPAGATSLPPMRMQEQPSVNNGGYQHHRIEENRHLEQPRKEEKPVGGVSAKLDYDMEVMTDFVSEMTQGIVQPGRAMPPPFRKWVNQVLCATRLPSATILLSLHYLSVRMQLLSRGGHFVATDGQIYRLLTIAMVLGSKFLDDNTFINRSWSEVSGISVTDLNKLETEWLVAIEFKLHRDPSEQQGFLSWHDHWKDYETQSVTQSSLRPAKLSPIDTNVQRQNSVHKPFSPGIYQQPYNAPVRQDSIRAPQTQYNANAFTQFDPWLVPRSTADTSPASAPHTGPTTPEFYGGPGTWAPPEGYSRRTMFGFPASSQSHTQPSQQTSTYNNNLTPFTPHFTAPAWGNHGHAYGCTCFSCCRQHPSYMMAPGFGPQSVAG
ncbi:hypothetical protein M501DRAFT_59194 [Patellaria atrata CBS 101060]|uniref:Cyclin-like protein n=1 Tax=Patellaria atrata CBS 101060 TaxID=1346257 RepID=A0A9P4SIS6_9PEZI|nr:hypothetical protein M501DRAFT_59194 [Patellaria atrata CBS 101060]